MTIEGAPLRHGRKGWVLARERRWGFAYSLPRRLEIQSERLSPLPAQERGFCNARGLWRGRFVERTLGQ